MRRKNNLFLTPIVETVYSHDRPSGLPLNVLFAGALRGAFAFTLHALRLLVVAFVWAVSTSFLLLLLRLLLLFLFLFLFLSF
jgi:hypothetical protein